MYNMPMSGRGGSGVVGGALARYISPKRRLDTLFALHSTLSIIIGAIGYIYPSSASVIFLTENMREADVARAILRPYCSLVLAQGIIVWRARRINEGEIKRAFVQAYFACFFLSTVSLIIEHLNNGGRLGKAVWDCTNYWNDRSNPWVWLVRHFSAAFCFSWLGRDAISLSLSKSIWRCPGEGA